MRKNHTGINAKNSFVTGIIIGSFAALLITVLLSAGLTSLVLNGSAELDSAGFIMFIIRIISSLLGCLIAVFICKEKMLLTIGLTSLGYLVTLLAIGIVFFGGSFQHFGTGMLSVVMGGVSAVIIKMLQTRTGKHTKRRYK